MQTKPSSVLENTFGTFRCVTSACSDGPKAISWDLSGKSLTGSQSSTTSTLNQMFPRGDNGKTLRCKTDTTNDILTLNITCK